MLSDAKQNAGQTITDAEEKSKGILEEAKQKADEMLAASEVKVEEKRAEQNKVIRLLERENDKYLAYIKSVEGGVQQIEKNLAELKGKFSMVTADSAKAEDSSDE